MVIFSTLQLVAFVPNLNFLVGDLAAIVLTNDSNIPWFCNHVTIRSDGESTSFKVKRWIGMLDKPSVIIQRNSGSTDLETLDIDCFSRAVDIFEE